MTFHLPSDKSDSRALPSRWVRSNFEVALAGEQQAHVSGVGVSRPGVSPGAGTQNA